jgi:hypothetical protein
VNDYAALLSQFGPTEEDKAAARQQAIMRAGMGILAASGPSRLPQNLGGILAQGGMQGMDAYNADLKRLTDEKKSNALMAAQLGKIQQEKAQQQRIEQYAQSLPEPERARFMVDPAAYIRATAPKPQEPYTLTPGAERRGPNNELLAQVPTRPPAPPEQSQIAKLMDEQKKFPPGSPQWKIYEAAIQRQTAPAASTANMVAVVGANGQPEYVPESEAKGRRPWNPRNSGQLPPSALKMQNDLLEEIGIAGSIKSDLAALSGQMATGDVTVGPVRNLVNAARNATGFSNEESQNYNTLRTTLERLRNDSLRLNKGVQTEGDAQRVWAELMGSLNDPAVVQKRLQEIQAINERAATLKRMQIDSIRANFGMEGMDVQQFAKPPAAIGKPYGGPDRRKPQQGFRIIP